MTRRMKATDLRRLPEVHTRRRLGLEKKLNAAELGIGELLGWLKGQAVYGRTHLEIAKGLAAAQAETARVAPTFFDLTLEAHLQAAQMYVAKLYDKQADAVTVKTLLDRTERLAATFPSAKPERVREIVQIALSTIAELEPKLDAVQIRRNEYLAHLDPGTIRNIDSMNRRAALTIADLDFILVETTNILNLFSQAFDGTLSTPMLTGFDDYKNVLKLVWRVEAGGTP
jgi:hypothetical protein